MALLSSISNIAVEFQTTRLLRAGRDTLMKLSAQIATGKKTSDLSELGATQTRSLLNARAGVAKSENYILAIKTVETRLTIQGKALENMQTLGTQAESLINNIPTHASSVTAGGAAQFENFLRQINMLLNQRVEDRQIFAGARYAQEPVKDLLSLPVPPTEAYPFTPLTSPALPQYDTSNTTQLDVTSIASDGAGVLTLGSSTWAAQGYQVGDTITLSGTTIDGTYTIQSLNGADATLTTSPALMAADTDFNAIRNNATAGPAAYDEDSLYIEDNLRAPYGVTSTDPAFQNLILGMRWAYAATQDPANYETYMARALDLLGDARDGVRVLEAETAANSGLFEDRRKAHEMAITQYSNQEGDAIGANVEEAATRLSILSAQLEASYAATGRVITLSIVNYI